VQGNTIGTNLTGSAALPNNSWAGVMIFNGASNNNIGTMTLKNTILANNGAANCVGALGDGGHNLQYPGTSCGATITVGNPVLAALANNGGPTMSMRPQSGSLAVDAGDPAICTALPVNNLDQRGTTRPVDGNNDSNAICDIGAYEAAIGTNPSAPAPVSPVEPQPTVAPTFVPQQ
jgi:hypothetical protein